MNLGREFGGFWAFGGRGVNFCVNFFENLQKNVNFCDKFAEFGRKFVNFLNFWREFGENSRLCVRAKNDKI